MDTDGVVPTEGIELMELDARSLAGVRREGPQGVVEGDCFGVDGQPVLHSSEHTG
jgi:hypothetical protein